MAVHLASMELNNIIKWCGAGRWIGFPRQRAHKHPFLLMTAKFNPTSKHTATNPTCCFVIKVISITPSAIRLSPIWPDGDLSLQERKVKPNTHLASNALCQPQFGPSQETQQPVSTRTFWPRTSFKRCTCCRIFVLDPNSVTTTPEQVILLSWLYQHNHRLQLDKFLHVYST